MRYSVFEPSLSVLETWAFSVLDCDLLLFKSKCKIGYAGLLFLRLAALSLFFLFKNSFSQYFSNGDFSQVIFRQRFLAWVLLRSRITVSIFASDVGKQWVKRTVASLLWKESSEFTFNYFFDLFWNFWQINWTWSENNWVFWWITLKFGRW